MLKHNRVFILSAVLVIAPTFLTTPANAQTKVYVVGERDRDSARDGESSPCSLFPLSLGTEQHVGQT